MIEAYELIGADRAKPLPGAIALIRSIAASDRHILIVTSNSSRTIARWLERFDLQGCVKSIVGRDSMLPLKPATDMINLALEHAAESATAALFIGDSDADAIAAQRAGVPFYGISRAAEKRACLFAFGAIDVFANPADLAARLGEFRL
jgi:phosphoglycolate phosphatase-like HAD superfamily hydrolase